ncbi:hypothetical protein M426DRAFT_17768 [Hypoxylon sp. CI-4A]|nr:hypothetical protein M426DRAFT_17768 [Hypoxylon sp. CI-4A]
MSSHSSFRQSTWKTNKSSRYESLSTEEPNDINLGARDDDNDNNILQDAGDYKPGILESSKVAIAAVLILLSGLLATVFIRSSSFGPRRSGSSSSGADAFHCGGTSNTTAEARELGCVFDILSYSWTPRPCFEEATASEFGAWLREPQRQRGPFPFFYDLEGRHRVADEEALAEMTSGGDANATSTTTTTTTTMMIYTTAEEQLAHCVFMMRRIHRAAESNGRVRLSSQYADVEYTKTCAAEILESFQREDRSYLREIKSQLSVSFESC